MAMPRGLLLCGAAAAVLALAARLLLAPQPAGEFPAFEAVAPGVRRLNFWWRPLPVVAAPVATFLVNVTDAAGAAGLVLVDAGVPDAPAVRGLLQRLSAEAAPLRLLVVTHGHPDHVGALGELQAAFPDLAVVMHEAEAPFMVGRAPRRARYSAVPSESAAYTVFQRLAEQLMSSPEADAGRTFLLSGGSGDVSEATAGGRRPAWALPRGVLSFVHVPGHAPGQIALLHEPSGTLLAADVVAYGKGLTGTSAAALTMAPGPATANMTQARLDAERLAALPFTRLFPSHDAGAGVTHSALADLLGSLPRAL